MVIGWFDQILKISLNHSNIVEDPTYTAGSSSVSDSQVLSYIRGG